ncbi:HIT family protein [Lactiplantibacillus mudanjiangensis]|uniref:HIT family hydrolase [Lactobacillus paraplantarum] n=1 Tax=Lactiplantibacillus mudanjiangensis TaxID=1296538 RepID=A0A660DZF3_9LACO|nr:HIT family protein [Lactiplantibacillus mudanjiangensis]VDG18834.1 HIT family hydrolase [Lactobacillus paraplantarum] [Lactiplantibacillus mudanjiangensis]VDG25387.1 HIT family hydrolase [Lactobacillus paraplantarum] [Lactiplantibacillus mudanjiangensis]VDG27582.1 HIT family hydrolase [Lactobacillus paraplantarum] [Lactiplantibacillus mudanjiangensis]VDG32932.1 HIT family hydrolase [Lactobacillus paraplantarum] [Lactiplantibacillus mudanjiangensis]
MTTCIFCQPQPYVLENELAAAFFDIHPVSRGHLLIIPKGHYPTYFDVPAADLAAMQALLVQAKAYLDDRYHPAGYNLGFNVGPVAGQTVMHCHLHVIPRYVGDVPDPTGGIRKMLPTDQSEK